MKLSKEQKDQAIEALNLPWGRVTLRCDGYLVTLVMQRFGKASLTYRVSTYVNGRIEWSWCSEKTMAPESKFLRKSVRPNVGPAKRKEVEKALGKRAVKKDPFWSGSVTLYLPDWANGKMAVNHLCKVSESVELLSAEEASVALDAVRAAQKQEAPVEDLAVAE